MRYHPRIQTAALKVGFHALLLHKYSKRLQTYSRFSQLLLLKMLDGKFFNSLLFNRLSKINECISLYGIQQKRSENKSAA